MVAARRRQALPESEACTVKLRASMHDVHADNDTPLAPALLAWHARHGRHDLPWQRERTPYRVWVSEVMLQQTQVQTVLGYFDRFMQRFPDLGALADAPQDEVLHLWTGLGYYARARNLQRAAQQVRDAHGGEFPKDFDAVAALPGIGPSTAGAILALALDQHHAICDGNVRRVLSRVFALEGRPGERAHEQALWHIARRETPVQDVATYTQAIMDLGATVCTRRNPDCLLCPLSGRCAARATGRQHELPWPKKPLARRQEDCVMLLACNELGAVWLQQRPARGLWGGLWSLPQFVAAGEADAFLPGAAEGRMLPVVDHAFTHFDLRIQPLLARAPEGWVPTPGGPEGLWYNPRNAARVGLPAPVASLLAALPDLLAAEEP
ncbi:MAG: hypothetical protein RL026_2070 [Pseudomonadota bacterium]|jgi:A/G-specific adenine glycosylase